MKKEQKFEILKTGNFYFPVKDIGKKFIVLNTFDFEIDKNKSEFLEIAKKHKILYFREYAEPIWKEIKKFIKKNKEYKNCWFVPTTMHEFNDKITVSVDILKPTR